MPNPNFTDPQFLRSDQYRGPENLNARMALHARFSTNPTPWHRWNFSQLDLPSNAHILELGGGPGDLWLENQDRIPPGWQLTFTDLSEGMLSSARENLGPHLRCACTDARHLPFPSDTFHAVTANHMLYHVPDIPQALAEIRRVLRPGGRLYAATNGEAHMREMFDLIHSFDPAIDYSRPSLGFSLHNSLDQLSPYFTNLEKRQHPNTLQVTEAAALTAYFASMSSLSHTNLGQRQTELTAHFQSLIDQSGPIHIAKQIGVLIGEKAP